jgi:hypothetical protein
MSLKILSPENAAGAGIGRTIAEFKKALNE